MTRFNINKMQEEIVLLATSATQNERILELEKKISYHNYCKTITGKGNDILLHLFLMEQLPSTVFIDLQIQKCDGLVFIILCKKLFPTIIVIGICAEEMTNMITSFFKEGGNGLILEKSIREDSNFCEFFIKDIFQSSSKKSNILSNKNFEEEHVSEYNDLRRYLSTKQIVSKYYSHLTSSEVLFLQLSAAGFTISQISLLMETTIEASKILCKNLYNEFKVKNLKELNSKSKQSGVVKSFTTA